MAWHLHYFNINRAMVSSSFCFSVDSCGLGNGRIARHSNRNMWRALQSLFLLKLCKNKFPIGGFQLNIKLVCIFMTKQCPMRRWKDKESVNTVKSVFYIFYISFLCPDPQRNLPLHVFLWSHRSSEYIIQKYHLLSALGRSVARRTLESLYWNTLGEWV